jgi:hypothetical protein
MIYETITDPTPLMAFIIVSFIVWTAFAIIYSKWSRWTLETLDEMVKALELVERRLAALDPSTPKFHPMCRYTMGGPTECGVLGTMKPEERPEQRDDVKAFLGSMDEDIARMRRSLETAPTEDKS